MIDQEFTKFHHPNFYTSIVKSHMSVGLPPLLTNIKQIEDIFEFLGTHAQQLAGYH